MHKVEERVKFLDITKGLGIIMIVWGHAKGLFSSQFILLAVPLFFIISGFFHNQKDDFKTFFMKKFFRLYLPFVSCNLFLPTLTLIKRQILGLDITPNIAYIVQILLTINKDGFLFGATWFLASLFSISIIIKLLETILKIKHKEFAIGLCCILLANFAFMPALNLDFGIRRTLLCTLFYFIGILVKQHWNKIQKHICSYPCITIATLVTIFLWQAYPSFSYKAPTVFGFSVILIGSLAFAILVLRGSMLHEKNSKTISSALSTVGTNSIHILIWHFVFFEIITAIILYRNHLPITIIETLPHVICDNPLCIGIYFTTGLLGSLGLAFIYKKVYKLIKSKLTI